MFPSCVGEGKGTRRLSLMLGALTYTSQSHPHCSPGLMPTASRFAGSFESWTRDVWCLLCKTRGSNISMSHLRAQPPFRSKRHRTGPVTKSCMEQGGGEKKGQNCLCTHCIPGYLYRVRGGGLCRLHVSAWWELLNYGWMFLITPHKCWNITLCQCLEDEEGGLRRLACLGKHWLALNHGGPCVMALEMWLWEKSEHSFCWREGEEMGNKTKEGAGVGGLVERSFGGVLEPVILGST